MSNPVVTSKWAGTFECGTCRRKRLMGEEFSKKALERHRKDGGPLKCKDCVAETELLERERAQARRKDAAAITEQSTSNGANANDVSNQQDEEKRVCSGSCGKKLPQSSYNRNQWSKGDGKSRCRECVEKAVKDEANAQIKAKDDKLTDAMKKVEEAKATGNSAKILAAESVLAALEAEKVTGLKPIKVGRGRGRGGRGRGGGRGRAGGRR